MRRGASYQNFLKSIAVEEGHLTEAATLSWGIRLPLEERIGIRNTLRALSTAHLYMYVCMYVFATASHWWTQKGREPGWCSLWRSAWRRKRQTETELIQDNVCPSAKFEAPPYESFTFTLHCFIKLGSLQGIIWHVQLTFLSWLLNERTVYRSVGIICLLIKETDMVCRGVRGKQERGVVTSLRPERAM